MTSLSTLPLQVKLGLRDAFDSEDASVNKALKSFNKTVGYDFTVEVAWVDLWNDLQSKFPDRETFVPTITDAIVTFIQRTENLLETSEGFGEIFIEKMERLRKAIFIQIHDSPNPKTALVRGELLTLFLPKGDANAFTAMYYKIGADIESVFTDKEPENEDQGAPGPAGDNDDFVEVLPGGKDSQTQAAPVKVRTLPNVNTLPRPDMLFSTLLPYTVIVRKTGGGVDIECSHQPTLELISEYFKRHLRKNLNHSRQAPYFKVEMIPSSWGPGTYHDVVRISREDERATWVRAEITPILAFIEGVCGYTLYKVDGDWIFRRTVPFN